MSALCRICGADCCNCKPRPAEASLWDSIGQPPSSEPETSAAAAASVASSAGAIRRRVLEWLRATPSTNEEIQQALGLSGDTVRPRVWELRGNGGHVAVVRDSGERRRTEAGRSAKVWEVAR